MIGTDTKTYVDKKKMTQNKGPSKKRQINKPHSYKQLTFDKDAGER